MLTKVDQEFDEINNPKPNSDTSKVIQIQLTLTCLDIVPTLDMGRNTNTICLRHQKSEVSGRNKDPPAQNTSTKTKQYQPPGKQSFNH